MTAWSEVGRLLLTLLGVGELERSFVEVWSLSFDDIGLIEGVNRSGRVWFAFQFSFFRERARFPSRSGDVRAAAEAEFTKSVAEQDADLLEEIASDANAYSNLVSRITDEYNDYLRENSRYDFVTEEVRKAPIVESLLALDSEFKGIRNQAYLNLGIIAMDDGREMEAFLFFNDAYRLSVFSCSEGVDNCVRYQAEQYMKSLLGVEGDSYIYWQR